jgi:hypothetical protein
MTEPRSKSAGPLSETAKSHIQRLAAEEIFGVEFEIHDKRLEKGNRVEGDAIALVNRVRGLSLMKNKERRDNGLITGEADCFDEVRRIGHDTKCSWSIQTFPLIVSACYDKDYLWQMQGYMQLWDAEAWSVDYVLLDTPEDLIGYEPQAIHFVSHIAEHLRLTSWVVHRDRSLEEPIREKVMQARRYYAEVIAEFDLLHRQGAPAPAIDPMTAPWDMPTQPKPTPKPSAAELVPTF